MSLLSRRRLFAAIGGSAVALLPARPAGAVFPDTAPGRLVTLGVARRVFDSREPGFLGGKLAAGEGRTINVSVWPAGFATAVFLNLTVTETEGAGFLRVHPADESGEPAVQVHSNINWSSAGVTLANLVLTQVGQENSVVVECRGVGRTHVVLDVFGYVPYEPSV